MANRNLTITEPLTEYLLEVGTREPEILRRLREETAPMAQSNMQIGPDQGAFMAMLVRLMDAYRCLEIGTFTGYSSTAVGLALPPHGRMVCCDVSQEWTDIARRYWAEAGLADRIELRLAPAAETLEALLADGAEFDFAFIDADKAGYDTYYEYCLRLVRRGGLITIDNVLWSGRVADPSENDPDTTAIRALNAKIAADERVDAVIVPIGDGLTLARVR
ncbi:MAG: class I SAM-dependent methyltransferase [Chloroflexota bacterium]